MLRAIGLRPFPQKRPGAVPEDGDYFWDIPAGSNGELGSYWPVSPETGLEHVPRHAITVLKVVDSR